MIDARTEILGRIRSQLARGAAPGAAAVELDYAAIPREYTRVGALDEQVRTRLLLDRLRDYDAEIFETNEQSLSVTIGEVLSRHTEAVLLVPAAIPSEWLPAGVEIVREQAVRKLPLDALTRAQAVLTTCAGAIAETGTILLVHGEEQGRRVMSLLPDHHLCILRRGQIVETVSQGMALVADRSTSAITTVSGPSATADIEMTRIRGVHGPRRLTILLLP